MVRKRGNTWMVDVRIGPQRHRESFKSEIAAISRDNELRMAAALGQEPTAPDRTSRKLTMGDLLERTVQRQWKGQKSADKTELKGRLVVRYFGASKLASDITTEDVNDYIMSLEKSGNAGATVNTKLAALSSMLKLAFDEGYISVLPRLKRQRVGQGRIRFLSDDEEARLLACLKVWGWTDLHDLVIFLLDTGARCGEALKLQWQDVTEKRVTFVDTKNGTTRAVPLTTRAHEALVASFYRGNKAQPFPLDYDAVHRQWERVRLHLGFAEDTQFVLHMLRHTCASRLIQRGASLVKVKEWMGHKTITVTMKYVHLAPNSLDELVGLLDRPAEAKQSHLRSIEGGNA